MDGIKQLVIVNCQNCEILKSHVSEDGKMDMPLLNPMQARKLFMFHAFGGASYVWKGFEKISNQMVATCDATFEPWSLGHFFEETT